MLFKHRRIVKIFTGHQIQLFSHNMTVALVVAMSVYAVHHFIADTHISSAIERISVKLCADIHISQRMNPIMTCVIH